MDNPVSPLMTSSSLPVDSRSPSQPRSPWSSLMSPTPNRARFPAMVLANLIRHKPGHSSPANNALPSPCLPNPSSPYSTTPGEDLNNFVWDAGCPSDSPRRAHHEEELYEIARLYQPSVGKRTRPTPQPIITRRDLLPLSTGVPEGALTPTLSSAGAFKSSIHRLLRKRTALHLKNSSQSSSSTTSPSETSADAEDRIHQELEETSDDEYRSNIGYSPFMHDDPHPSNAQPFTPSVQTHAAFGSPLSAPRTPARARRSPPEEEQFIGNPLPPRSSSIAQ
ncbi:hypothetical protein PTTG_07228 [Puccinia triticina 1-1 BBBD Race 1]|uniref:Uncharacterized protein n=2 Tax=Puccinia triticina TaxID=208348 RepID=A0A0C4F2A7_PUCT1|nr:uncharacterized protein PtA15_9A704 [Puccinia triticina]OAV97340.1 hypothetical protein PTTG_07228 [Puccinia triticina 1-1 BBBD Race 1]WAQ88577.1 hypothetical protein PtA15_9A704 [Puccinia triticina]